MKVKVGKDYFKLESAMQKLVDERKPLTKKIIKEVLCFCYCFLCTGLTSGLYRNSDQKLKK